jgi:hypothetical protein
MATARAPMLPRICRAIVQPIDPEVCDRGHIDQHFGDHDQRNSQQQQLAGQA